MLPRSQQDISVLPCRKPKHDQISALRTRYTSRPRLCQAPKPSPTRKCGAPPLLAPLSYCIRTTTRSGHADVLLPAPVVRVPPIPSVHSESKPRRRCANEAAAAAAASGSGPGKATHRRQAHPQPAKTHHILAAAPALLASAPTKFLGATTHA